MPGLHQPLRERQPIERRTRFERRQHRRNAWLYLLGLVPIVAAGEHEAFPRLLELGHDHSRRNRLLELFTLLLERLKLGVLAHQGFRCGVLEEVLTEILALFLRPLAVGAGQDGTRTMV